MLGVNCYGMLPSRNGGGDVCDDRNESSLMSSPSAVLASALERTAGSMTDRHHAVPLVLGGLTAIGVALAGAGPASADPADPAPTPAPTSAPAPLPVDAAAMSPNQPAPPAADPAAPPPPDPFAPYVPEIQNQTYGSGDSGGGVFGTLKDLWRQVQNPTFAPNEIMGSGGAAPPPGAAPAPALPPGYVSTNFPGSETPVTAPSAGGGSATVGPALPPGYYPLTGPPPPGYSYAAPGSTPAAIPGFPSS